MVRGSSGHQIRSIVAVEAGGAFQLDVHLQLTNGIKELCCGAQNRTEKSIPKREREKKKKMTQTWEASFWNNLKRPVLTQTHEYNSHSLCRTFFFFPFHKCLIGTATLKNVICPFPGMVRSLCHLGRKKKKAWWFYIFDYLWSSWWGDQRKYTNLNINSQVCMERE